MIDGKAAHCAQVSLLFRQGCRPDRAALEAIEAGFALIPHHAQSDDPGTAEILASGLTFDLSGLKPGLPAAVPTCGYRFDLPDNVKREHLESVTIVPGPHLSGGEAMVPVVRVLLNLAVELCVLDGLVAVAWHPARSWIGPRYFVSMTRNWLEGGVFPARGLVGLEEVADGGLQSEGASFFTGQEIRVEPELTDDRLGAEKIAVRLIDHLVEHGTLGATERISGPEGRMLLVTPSSNQRIVRIWGG